MSDDAKRGSPETHVDARLRVIVVFPGERAFGARLLSDTALLRRQSIDRLLRLSILHNEHPILCLRAERVAVSSQGTCIVFRHRSEGRSFPMRCEYSFHSGRGTAATVLTAIRTSRRVARSSVSRPEWSIPRPSRSPIPAPKRPSIGRVTRPGAAAERSGRMQTSATTRCTQSSLSVRKRGDRADFDKMYARIHPESSGTNADDCLPPASLGGV